jgi:hypothetical protein
MDLEQLTKHQIVLLTLLVSFVTSIATGIVTVSLMNQAPPAVTRTINQIVEHTIQTVAPSNNGPVVTTEKTVVVKDDDLVAQSIASLQKSIIRITARGDDALLARGVIIDKNGTALTDKASLLDSGAVAFDAILSSGERVPLTLKKPIATSSALTAVLVAVGTSTGFAPAKLGNTTNLKLGQSVLRISGKGVDVVGEGVVAMLPSKLSPDSIEASVEASTPGSILANLFGEIIGMTTTSSLVDGSSSYTVAANVIQAVEVKTETKTAASP